MTRRRLTRGLPGLVLAFGCTAAAVQLIAQVPGTTPAEAAQPLTLAECVNRALAKGFDLEIQRQSLLIAQDDIPIARSTFRPVISANTAKSSTRTATQFGTAASRSDETDASVSLSQRMLLGTELGLGVQNSRSYSDPAEDALNPAYSSDVTLSIRQPLLKGFGRRLNSQVIRRAELNLGIADSDYEGRALDVVQNTENAYYLLTGARDQLGVYRSSLQLAQALLNESNSRRDAGMATRLDVLQAEVGVANARRSVLEAQRTVRASEDQLSALIGRFQFDTPIGETRADTDAANEPAPTIGGSYQLALARYPGLLSARATRDLAQLDVESSRNDLLPSLDLDLALGFSGDDRTRHGSFSGVTDPDGHSWQAGISITYPLGRTAEKARFRQSKYALTQADLRVHQLEQDVLVAVRNAVRDVETSQESVTIAAQAAQLAQRQYEAETARFRAGLSTSRRVLEAQTDLESARVAHLQARLDLQTARASLRRLEGSSLSRYGITLIQ